MSITMADFDLGGAFEQERARKKQNKKKEGSEGGREGGEFSRGLGHI